MKHDKLKSECFNINTITGQKPKQNNFLEKRKQGKFKSMQKIIDKNKEINELISTVQSDKRVTLDKEKAKKKVKSLTMSSAHM